MTYQTALTSTATLQKPRALALGFVVLLHLGLVAALTTMDRVAAPPPSPTYTAEYIELTKPTPAPPPTLRNATVEQPPIDREVFRLPTVTYDPDTTAITTRAAETQQRSESPAQVISPPRLDTRHPLTQPAYPSASRRAGEAGTVELSLYVLANGRIGDARVARSSGFARLDEAALKEALRRWRLLPQQVDGVAVAAWHKIAVTFRLEN